MSLEGAVSDVMGRYGGPWTLRSASIAAGANAWTAGAATAAYVACTARARRYKPAELKGGIVEGDVLVTIDAASLVATPKVGDRVSPGAWTGDAGAEWHQIVSVYAPAVGGATRAWKLQVRR